MSWHGRHEIPVLIKPLFFRPFFLNPAQDGPKEGEDKLAMYNRKFGAQRIAQMLPHMTQVIHQSVECQHLAS